MLEAKFLHHGFVNQNPREDHIRAVFGQAGNFPPFRQRQPPEIFPVGDDLFQGQNHAFNFFAVESIQLLFHTGENAGGAAGADETDGAGFFPLLQGWFEQRPDLGVKQVLHPVAASEKFSLCRWVADGKFLHESHRAERKAVGKSLFCAVAENEFRAAAADIEQQQWMFRQFRVRGHALKRPVRLAGAGDDFRGQTAGVENRGGQLRRIDGIPRRAGGDDAGGKGFLLAGDLDEFGHGSGGAGDRPGLKPVRFIESLAEARLPAVLMHRKNATAGHIGNQQLYGIGSNIYDGTANRSHWSGA